MERGRIVSEAHRIGYAVMVQSSTIADGHVECVYGALDFYEKCKARGIQWPPAPCHED